MMTSPDRPLHKNRLLVVGVLLLALGVGNWTIGVVWTQPHESYLKAHPGPRIVSTHPKAHLLQPPDAELERRNIARSKVDFYSLVQSGGRLMTLVGLLCLGGTLVPLRRRRWPTTGTSGHPDPR